jgi:hypothetical protein
MEKIIRKKDRMQKMDPFESHSICFLVVFGSLFRLKMEAQHRRQNNAYRMESKYENREANVTKALSQFI